jgi:hypothetical protein
MKSPPSFPAAAIAAWCGKKGSQRIKDMGERVNQQCKIKSSHGVFSSFMSALISVT